MYSLKQQDDHVPALLTAVALMPALAAEVAEPIWNTYEEQQYPWSPRLFKHLAKAALNCNYVSGDKYSCTKRWKPPFTSIF